MLPPSSRGSQRNIVDKPLAEPPALGLLPRPPVGPSGRLPAGLAANEIRNRLSRCVRLRLSNPSLGCRARALLNQKANLHFVQFGGLGFEPRLEESESSVLPLDDPPS